MAKYRLTAKHYWSDQLLNEGTIVGDETPYPVPKEGPTYDMEPLDDEAKAEIEKLVENRTKPMLAAPQLGLIYLTPDNQEVITNMMASQQAKKDSKPASKEK